MPCVEDLKIGDTICGHGLKNDAFPDVKIENIQSMLVESIYVITTKHGAITASADQLFYEITSEKFIPAEQIRTGHLLLTKDIKALQCTSVEFKNIQTIVYDLTLAEPHLFFSSDAQVLTHNAVPLLLLGIPIATPALKFVVSVGAIAGALYVEKLATSSLPIFAQCRKRRERKAQRQVLLARLNQADTNKSQTYPLSPPTIGNTIPSGGQAPDPNDPKKNEKDVFEDTLKNEKGIEKKSLDLSNPHNVNAQENLRSKLSELEKAQKRAIKIRKLPDGRIRYYEQERFAKTPGPTRGNARVTELDPKTGTVRSWEESYNYASEVKRVHPKSINGMDINCLHYPPTGTEIKNILK